MALSVPPCTVAFFLDLQRGVGGARIFGHVAYPCGHPFFALMHVPCGRVHYARPWKQMYVVMKH